MAKAKGRVRKSQRKSTILAGLRGKAVRAALFEALRLGASEHAACRLAEIDPTTFLKWKRKAEEARADGRTDEYTKLMDQAEQAVAEHQESMLCVVNAVAKNADEMGAKPADQLNAAKWALERRHGETFGARKAVEVSGPGGGPVQLQVLPPLVTAEAMAAGDVGQLRGLLAQAVAILAEMGEEAPEGDERGGVALDG